MENKIEQKIAEPKGLKHQVKKHKHLFAWTMLVVIILAIAGGLIYFKTIADKISIDKAEISASQIVLAPKAPGLLEEVFVNVGDKILADTVVARVGNNLIKTDVAGTVIAAQNNIGTLYNPGQPVVTVVQDSELKVVGQLAEDKGLKDVKVGQTALFTVDAYGSNKYFGVVDEVSATSRESGVTFNISDKRETKIFDIKIRFDETAYPELKNGMSAKIWIYKN